VSCPSLQDNDHGALAECISNRSFIRASKWRRQAPWFRVSSILIFLILEFNYYPASAGDSNTVTSLDGVDDGGWTVERMCPVSSVQCHSSCHGDREDPSIRKSPVCCGEASKHERRPRPTRGTRPKAALTEATVVVSFYQQVDVWMCTQYARVWRLMSWDTTRPLLFIPEIDKNGLGSAETAWMDVQHITRVYQAEPDGYRHIPVGTGPWILASFPDCTSTGSQYQAMCLGRSSAGCGVTALAVTGDQKRAIRVLRPPGDARS
jgi:hypothetical protein